MLWRNGFQSSLVCSKSKGLGLCLSYLLTSRQRSSCVLQEFILLFLDLLWMDNSSHTAVLRFAWLCVEASRSNRQIRDTADVIRRGDSPKYRALGFFLEEEYYG